MIREATAQRALAATATAVAALVLAACTVENSGADEAPSVIRVGTTDRVTALDPAGSYDSGSFAVISHVFPFLFTSTPGASDVEPDIASSAEFTAEGEFTVELKRGLRFANGNALTSSDVKFSFDRQLAIKDDNGPWTLLRNIDAIETPDEATVIFRLANGSDQTFPQVLASPAGPILDEEVFAADAVTPDDEIVKGEPFAGPYTISQYRVDESITFVANERYRGLLGVPDNDEVVLSFFVESGALADAVRGGGVDAAHRSLTPADVAELRADDGVRVIDGPGGEIRFLVFNFDTMPFGADTAEADPSKALAVRRAIAHIVDREELAEVVYDGSYAPLYAYLPDSVAGSVETLASSFGDGDGGPDADAASAVLASAGVATPVALDVQFTTDHYGEASADEYALLAEQLEASGLFEVELGSSEWTEFTEERIDDEYPVYQYGWFPDFADPANYLFFGSESILGNHFVDAAVDDALAAQSAATDPAARAALVEQIQGLVTEQLPTLPLLQGAQLVVVRSDVSGAVLDGSFTFRFGTLVKR